MLLNHNYAIFHKELLKYYQVLDRPGTFIVSVADNITKDFLYIKDDYPRYIIPLKVILSDKLPALISVLKDDNIVPFSYVRNYFITGALFENDVAVKDLPIKGEKIIATFEIKEERLMCTNIKLIDREDLMFVNVDAMDELYSLAKKYIS